MKRLPSFGSLSLWLPLAILLASPALPAQARPPRAAKAPANPADARGVVNINTAEPEQLRLLPGIGPSKAQRIVALRARRKFTHPYQIIRVKGIGRRTYLRLKQYLTVQGATTLKARPRPARAPRKPGKS